MGSIENIIWLASYPKSGNTWLRVLLNTVLADAEKEVSINRISITDGIISNRALFEKWIGVDTEELTKSEIDYFMPRVLKKRSESLNEPSFIKTHTANVKNQNGEYLFPVEATRKAIYIVRNPLDVCVSMAFHSGHNDFDTSIKTLNNEETILSDNPIEFNVQMHQYLGSWSNHYSSWINSMSSEKILVVRYEDMKNIPQKTFADILTFLNIPFSNESLIRSIDKCSFDNLKQQELKEGFNERPSASKRFFRKGIVGGWKKYLTKEQENIVIDRHAVVMKELGYIDSNNQLLI